MTELKPCPFCGGAPVVYRYDRLILIGCDKCGYSRGFKGLIQTVPSEVLASHPDSSIKEYYHVDADEKAIEVWNRRVDNDNGG